MKPFLAFLGCLCLVSAPGQAAEESAANRPAALLETGLVRSQRLASGVPLGGIGTGTFQLMTDGTVSRATILNNWQRPTGDLPGCFAALWTKQGDRSAARVLALRNAYQLPAIAALDYDGRAPQATLTFTDNALPVSISLLAFSPLIPHDVRNSSFPAAAFVFRLKNASPLPIEVSVALSWENILGAGSPLARTGSKIIPIPSAEGFFGLRFLGPPLSLTEDKSERPSAARGEIALMAYPPRPNDVVTTAGWNALAARPAWWDSFARDGSVSGEAPVGLEGSAHPAGVVAVHLRLSPGDSEEIPFAVAWSAPTDPALPRDAYYYQWLFPDTAVTARMLLSDWQHLYSLTTEWQNWLRFSSLPPWMTRRLLNSVSPLLMNTVHTRDGRFTFLEEVGLSPPEAGAPGRQGQSLATLSDRFSASALLLAFFPRLYAQELTQFAAAQSPEGIISPTLGPLVTFLRPSKDALPAFLPDLERPDISFWQLRPPTAAETESACAFVLQIAHYVLWTGDDAFLRRYLPAVRRALAAVLRNTDEDGLPLWKASQEERSFRKKGDTEVTLRAGDATLWLAALRAGQRLMERAAAQGLIQENLEVSDEPLFAVWDILMAREEMQQAAREAAGAFQRAAEGAQRRFWNGDFYADAPTAANSGPICSLDQLRGQGIADLLGLGPLLPKESLARVTETLEKRFVSAAVGKFGPPNRLAADGALPPNDPTAGDSSLSAALNLGALLIAQERPDAGLALLQRLSETRENVLHTPWQSPGRFRAETGQAQMPEHASLAHAADWNALCALQGFAWESDIRRLTLLPHLSGTWRRFSTPLFAPTFWGHLEYKPMASGGALLFTLDRLIALTAATPEGELSGSAALTLASLRVPGLTMPADGETSNLPITRVSRGRNPIGSRVEQDGAGNLLVTFDTPLVLTAGDRLEITVRR